MKALLLILPLIGALTAGAQDVNYVTFPKIVTNWRPNPANALYPLFNRSDRTIWWNDSTYSMIPAIYDTSGNRDIKSLQMECLFLMQETLETHRRLDSLIGEMKCGHVFTPGSYPAGMSAGDILFWDSPHSVMRDTPALDSLIEAWRAEGAIVKLDTLPEDSSHAEVGNGAQQDAIYQFDDTFHFAKVRYDTVAAILEIITDRPAMGHIEENGHTEVFWATCDCDADTVRTAKVYGWLVWPKQLENIYETAEKGTNHWAATIISKWVRSSKPAFLRFNRIDPIINENVLQYWEYNW